MTDWPVELGGVTESVVTTLGPNGLYNVAALGVHAPTEETDGSPRARTWGRTRTWRNFTERGEGYIQFVRDPVVFVDATLGIREVDEPVLPGAHAHVHVSVERLGSGTEGGTDWVDWRLTAETAVVHERVVPAFDRGYAAVVEATVAASRLDVESYDTAQLRERLAYFEAVARRCGGPAERAAIDRLHDLLEEDDGESP